MLFRSLIGVRPTWGRIPATGTVALAPGYDTVGWLTRSAGLAAVVGAALLDPWPLPPPAPFGRLVIATDAFRLLDDGLLDAVRPAVRLLAEVVGAWHEEALAPSTEFEGGLHGWARSFRVEQGRQVWETHGPWIERNEPGFGPGVAARFAWAASVGPDDVAATRAIRRAARRRLDTVLDGSVVCLPAACGEAPRPDEPGEVKEHIRTRTVALTAPAGLAGAPSISLPAGRGPHGPINLALLGAPGSDEALLELAVRYAAAGRSR